MFDMNESDYRVVCARSAGGGRCEGMLYSRMKCILSLKIP